MNKGIYSAIPLIWGLPPSKIDETKCLFKGDEYCEYHLKWKRRPFFKSLFQRIFSPWKIIEETVKELEKDGAANIHLLDPTDAMPQVYPRASVLVVSSLFEGFSNTILEAGASGVPVVATAVGGNPEAVSEGENGFLIPPEDPDALAQAVLNLLNNSRKLDDMKKASRQFVESHFSLERMVNRMEALYVAWLKRDRK